MNANARGHYTNNRNMDDMSNYQEDRIEALKRRIAELESENARLDEVINCIVKRHIERYPFDPIDKFNQKEN